MVGLESVSMEYLKNLSGYFNSYIIDSNTSLSQNDSKRLLFFSLPIVVMLCIYSVITFWVLKIPEMAYWELVCAAIALGSNIILKSTNNYYLAGNVLVFSGLLILSVISFFTGGIEGSVIFWIYLCPLCAGMILGRKAIVFWGLISFVVLILFNIFNQDIQNYPNLITDVEVLKSIKQRALFGILIFSVFMSYIYQYLVDKAVVRAEQKENHAKNLLRVVSHDIGNSLFLIDGNLKLLKKIENQESKSTRFMNRLSLGVGNIQEILNQVREVEALQSGKLTVELQKVNIVKELKSSIDFFQERLADKNIGIEFQSTLDSIFIYSDAVSLRNQILNNLISNAIKFSLKDSKIRIVVSTEDDYCFVNIIDTGLGMDQDLLCKIFDSSQKTTRVGTQGESGTGFGMPLIKAYMDYFKGTIDIRSKSIEEHAKGHGTTVELRFNLFQDRD